MSKRFEGEFAIQARENSQEAKKPLEAKQFVRLFLRDLYDNLRFEGQNGREKLKRWHQILATNDLQTINRQMNDLTGNLEEQERQSVSDESNDDFEDFAYLDDQVGDQSNKLNKILNRLSSVSDASQAVDLARQALEMVLEDEERDVMVIVRRQNKILSEAIKSSPIFEGNMFDFCRREEINSDIFFKLLNLKISPFSKQKTNRSVYRSDCHKIAKIFNKPIEELFNPNLYWRFVTDQVKENIIVHNKHNAKRGKGIIKLDRDYGEYEKNTIDRSVEVNGLFMRAFLKKYGHKRGNFTEFCQDVGVSLHALSRIKSFDSHAKYKIFKIKIGKIISYSETALKIAQVLETDPEQIFPARLYGFDDGGWDIEHDKRKISRGGADFEKMKDPEEILLEKEDVAVLKRILKESAKNDKEKEIFEMYYGLGAYDQEHTMEEIGEKFGVTREWVRQIITKMKKHLIKKIGVIDWNKKMKLKPMKIKK